MTDSKNILLVGVGGQGIILVSKILTNGLIQAGYDVKMSEVHGMAQRGGSVSTQVRFGKKVYSPIVNLGKADIIVSFEIMETLRWLEYIEPNGKVLVNEYKIPSAPILAGKADYPDKVLEVIQEKVCMSSLKAAEIANEIGNIKTMNIVMLGALAKSMNLMNVDWELAIKESVKPKFVDINIKAFEAGMKSI